VNLAIRPATPADLPLIAELIRGLAEYEKLADEVRFDQAVLGEKLFGQRPYAEVLIGEVDGEALSFALFFHNFSTFEGRPGIYLEDLFVRPEARGKGLGKALLAELARLAIALGWNGGCSIGTSPRSASTNRLGRGRWTNGR
jgi:GNAT superfamily N-acetyltransferase